MTERKSTEPVLQNLPPRTEIGRKLREVFGRAFSRNDAHAELRLLASGASDLGAAR